MQLFSEILPTLISVFVVVAIFLLGRHYDSKIRAKEIKRNWLMNVIVLPNINKVDKFITDISSKTNQSLLNLIKAKNNNTFQDYLLLKSKEIGSINSIRREFEFDFILLVNSGSLTIASNLTECLHVIEDSITNLLDREDLKELDFDEIENDLKKFKIDFYSILYSAIE